MTCSQVPSVPIALAAPPGCCTCSGSPASASGTDVVGWAASGPTCVYYYTGGLTNNIGGAAECWYRVDVGATGSNASTLCGFLGLNPDVAGNLSLSCNGPIIGSTGGGNIRPVGGPAGSGSSSWLFYIRGNQDFVFRVASDRGVTVTVSFTWTATLVGTCV